MDQRDDAWRPGPGDDQMVQQRWRSGNNRLDPGQLVHDHRGGGSAKWRAGRTISTGRATPKFGDPHPHQAAADPCGTHGFPERPDPKPDRAATPGDEDHPAGDVEPSYLPSDIYPDLQAAPNGTDPRAELATEHERVRAGHSGGHIVGIGPGHSTVHRDPSPRA